MFSVHLSPVTKRTEPPSGFTLVQRGLSIVSLRIAQEGLIGSSINIVPDFTVFFVRHIVEPVLIGVVQVTGGVICLLEIKVDGCYWNI